MCEYVQLRSHYLLLPINAPCVQKCKNYKNFDYKIRRDHQKNSNERRDYESVDL